MAIGHFLPQPQISQEGHHCHFHHLWSGLENLIHQARSRFPDDVIALMGIAWPSAAFSELYPAADFCLCVPSVSSQKVYTTGPIKPIIITGFPPEVKSLMSQNSCYNNCYSIYFTASSAFSDLSLSQGFCNESWFLTAISLKTTINWCLRHYGSSTVGVIRSDQIHVCPNTIKFQ